MFDLLSGTLSSIDTMSGNFVTLFLEPQTIVPLCYECCSNRLHPALVQLPRHLKAVDIQAGSDVCRACDSPRPCRATDDH